MLDVVLYRPMIPPNTGNIIRLCANTGARLHLVGPLKFDLSEPSLRRAGLDYHDLAPVTLHDDWDALRNHPGLARSTRRWFAVEAGAKRRYDQVRWRVGDVVVFGRERTGLPESVLGQFEIDRRVGIPMRPGNRSLNLANAVSIVAYEAWRQVDFT